MYLDCLRRLDALGLVMTDGPVENLGLVMGVMCWLADRWEVMNDEKETHWTKEIVKMAKERGVEMLVVEDRIGPYEPEEEEEEEEEGVIPSYDFLQMMARYKRQWGRSWSKACIDLSKPEVREMHERIIDATVGDESSEDEKP